ncbi:hypothetical protein MHYP_G00075990 [Metynnis hypsauchen]
MLPIQDHRWQDQRVSVAQNNKLHLHGPFSPNSSTIQQKTPLLLQVLTDPPDPSTDLEYIHIISIQEESQTHLD